MKKRKMVKGEEEKKKMSVEMKHRKKSNRVIPFCTNGNNDHNNKYMSDTKEMGWAKHALPRGEKKNGIGYGVR
jgi:hypothetical protein